MSPRCHCCCRPTESTSLLRTCTWYIRPHVTGSHTGRLQNKTEGPMESLCRAAQGTVPPVACKLQRGRQNSGVGGGVVAHRSLHRKGAFRIQPTKGVYKVGAHWAHHVHGCTKGHIAGQRHHNLRCTTTADHTPSVTKVCHKHTVQCMVASSALGCPSNHNRYRDK
jgi:hypothetical protein